MPTDSRRIRNYEILRTLSGGMGQVHEARETQLGHRVALKAIRQDLVRHESIRERFRREARALAHVNHENVVGLHEFFEHDGELYLAMQWVEGGDLQEHLDAHPGPWPIDVALQVLVGIASGLAAAHAKGLVHRDVKPANVILASDGAVKLTDFGLVRSDDGDPTLTAHGHAVGTVAYMSPEQLGGREVTAATDLFSLGLVAFRLLSGIAARKVASTTALALGPDAHLPPLEDWARDSPEAVADHVDRMLAVDPARRPSATETVDAFEHALLDLEETPRTPTERRRAVVAFLGCLPDTQPAGVETSPLPDTVDRQRLRPASRSSMSVPGGWAGLVTLVVVVTALVGWLLWPDQGALRWVDLRLGSEADVYCCGDRLVERATRQAMIPAYEDTVRGIWIRTEHAQRIPMGPFVVAPGETHVTPVQMHWGIVNFESEPPGAELFVDARDSVRDGGTLYLPVGRRTVRGRSPAGPLQAAILTRATGVEDLDFVNGPSPGEFTFEIDVASADQSVGMIFEPLD